MFEHSGLRVHQKSIHVEVDTHTTHKYSDPVTHRCKNTKKHISKYTIKNYTEFYV